VKIALDIAAWNCFVDIALWITWYCLVLHIGLLGIVAWYCSVDRLDIAL
jgi:hypothetical protein